MRNALTTGLALILLMAAAPALAVTPVTPPKAPAAFQGLWAGLGKSCTPGADPSQIRIRANSVWMSSHDHQVLRATPRGPREVVMVVQVLSGDVYEDRTFRFRLSADGKQLTEVGARANLVRRLCAKP